MPIALQIQPRSATPKYRQIANAIRRGIERKIIGREEQLPSINELSAHYNISRDTAEKAYRLLKKQGMIMSVRGKGYFAVTDQPLTERRILLLFPKLSPYKEAIYNGFVQTIGRQATVDLKVYYNDFALFESLLETHATGFSDFVVVPAFRGEDALRARGALDRHLAGRNLTLVERNLPELREKHRGVVQNFSQDIYGALGQAKTHLQRYERLRLYFPFDCQLDRGIINGFQRFCQEEEMRADIVFKNFEDRPLEKGTAYIVVRDEQLVTLAHQINHQGLTVGRDVGILAYNDSPLKQVLLNGITVMTTRHAEMGRLAAELVLSNRWEMVENDFVFVERGSL